MGSNDAVEDSEVWQRIRTEYEQKTGEQLPDHVLKNMNVLAAAGPSVKELEKSFEAGKQTSESYRSNRMAYLGFILVGVTTAAIGYVAGLSLASNFGTAVIALVAVGVGFIIGAIL